MSVRAKFIVQSVTQFVGETRQVRLCAVHDTSIPEDQSFTKYTPNGTIEMTIDNPPASDQFVPGKKFYVDFTPAE